MTCPNCNADLPDSTLFCPQCGSSTRQAAFSYLPAGAPPWPTTIPTLPLHKTGSLDQNKDQGETLSAAKLVPRPRRSARSILALVAVLLLAPLIGAGATLGILWANGQLTTNATQVAVHLPPRQPAGTNNTPAATGGQLPTPTAFHTISTTSSNSLGITMKFPQDWVETPTTQPTQYGLISADFHPQQQIGIDLTIKRIPSKSLAGATIKDVNQANIDSFGTYQNVNNIHSIASPNSELTVGGMKWAEQDAAFTDNNQLTYHFTVISVLHNQYYYSFTFYAPDNNYNEAMQKYFQPILKSFAFHS